MKKLVLIFLLIFLATSIGNASLYDRGNGMIYSSILDMTWIQDTTPYTWMSWDDAVKWAANLEYGGYNDWRLPTSFVDDGEYEKNSEFGILYHDELGNDWRLSWAGLPFDSGPFLLSWIGFWSSGESEHTDPNFPGEEWAHGFFWDDGTSFIAPKTHISGVWAVREGDVSSVPIPSTFFLLITGLLTLFYEKTRKK